MRAVSRLGRAFNTGRSAWVANIPGNGRIVRTVRTKELGYTEKVDVDVVQVTATVVDDRGRYVQGLTRDAFHVFEDDLPHAATLSVRSSRSRG